MDFSRRDFVKSAAVGMACTLSAAGLQAQNAGAPPVKVGMTDWNLGERGDITKFELARQLGLDGIQVSVIFPEDGSLHLRNPKVQEQFRKASLASGVQICSLAIGSPGKTRLPLNTNPAAGILLVEAIEVARNIGTTDILYPVLGASRIHPENQAEVDLFVAMMKEVGRHAEKAGVVVSLEHHNSAADMIKILDRIGSDYVAVYYDARNTKGIVGDPYGEAALLGKRIHQLHVKNGKVLMREKELLDWPRLAQEFYDSGYKGWYVLETGSPSGDLIKDTRDNIDYVRKTFKVPA